MCVRASKVSTWGFTRYCGFCTLRVCAENLQTAPSLGQGSTLFYACKALSMCDSLTQRADNYSMKEGFMTWQSLSLSCSACTYRSRSSGFQSPWCALLSVGWELQAAPLSLRADGSQGWAALPCTEQLWLKWWQGPLLKIKFCLIFCAVLVSHIRE